MNTKITIKVNVPLTVEHEITLPLYRMRKDGLKHILILDENTELTVWQQEGHYSISQYYGISKEYLTDEYEDCSKEEFAAAWRKAIRSAEESMIGLNAEEISA